MTEVSWFSALCDDDYAFLGVAQPQLRSSWDHCRNIVDHAERNGFDNVLLPSGYELGIDATAFAAAIATQTTRINLLLAVRAAELWPPQLARQLATIDQMSQGRLSLNIISSDLVGAPMASGPRYRRTTEIVQILRHLLNGETLDFHGEFFQLQMSPPAVRPSAAPVHRSISVGSPRTLASVRRRGRRVPHVARHHGRSRFHHHGHASPPQRLPHIDECDLFAHHVLPRLEHAPLQVAPHAPALTHGGH